MIHFTKDIIRLDPIGSSQTGDNLDRIQRCAISNNLNREKIKEIGRSTNDGLVGYKKKMPEIRADLTQFELGNMEIYKWLANKSTVPQTLSDYNTPISTLSRYKTDDNGTFLGTLVFPKTRVAGFGWNISAPDANIERSFNLVGDTEYILQGVNKYFITKKKTLATGDIGSGNVASFVISDPFPVQFPDDSTYIMYAYRIRSGVTTELVLTTDYTYTNGTHTMTVDDSQAGDVICYAYSAGSYIAGVDLFTDNDTDPVCIGGESVSIYLNVSNYMYKLNSASVDVSLDRQDIGEIGNRFIVARGVRSKTVSCNIGRYLDSNLYETLLAGVASTYGRIDSYLYASNASLVVKFYSDYTKTTFKYGFKASGLSPVTLNKEIAIDDYAKRDLVLEGESLTVSTTEGDLV